MMVMKAGAEGQEEQQQSVAVTLLLSSTEDPASVNLCAALIDRVRRADGWMGVRPPLLPLLLTMMTLPACLPACVRAGGRRVRR